MPWSNQSGGGGGWQGGGGGNNRGPWGQGPGGGQGGRGPTPPDLEDLIKKGQDKLRDICPAAVAARAGRTA